MNGNGAVSFRDIYMSHFWSPTAFAAFASSAAFHAGLALRNEPSWMFPQFVQKPGLLKNRQKFTGSRFLGVAHRVALLLLARAVAAVSFEGSGLTLHKREKRFGAESSGIGAHFTLFSLELWFLKYSNGQRPPGVGVQEVGFPSSQVLPQAPQVAGDSKDVGALRPRATYATPWKFRTY